MSFIQKFMHVSTRKMPFENLFLRQGGVNLFAIYNLEINQGFQLHGIQPHVIQ